MTSESELHPTIRDEVARAELFCRALIADAENELLLDGHSWWTDGALDEVRKCTAAIIERVLSMVDLPY